MPGARRNPWIARVTVGWEIATATKGKRKGREIQRQKYQTIGYYPTRKEALAALSKHHGSPASSRYNITLGQLFELLPLSLRLEVGDSYELRSIERIFSRLSP